MWWLPSANHSSFCTCPKRDGRAQRWQLFVASSTCSAHFYSSPTTARHPRKHRKTFARGLFPRGRHRITSANKLLCVGLCVHIVIFYVRHQIQIREDSRAQKVCEEDVQRDELYEVMFYASRHSGAHFDMTRIWLFAGEMYV